MGHFATRFLGRVGGIRYAYDQLRAKGSSAADATSLIKALIIMGTDPKALTIGGVGLTGVHIGEDRSIRPEEIAKDLAKAVARERAAS